jgi:hypothetical protein
MQPQDWKSEDVRLTIRLQRLILLMMIVIFAIIIKKQRKTTNKQNTKDTEDQAIDYLLLYDMVSSVCSS